MTALAHPTVFVGDAPVGGGAAIYATQHVKTDTNGQVSYTIGIPVLLTCSQDTGTDVTAEPSSAVLLRYNLDSDNTVTCGTSPNKGDQILHLSVAHLTITVTEPVFTIVRQHDETIIRVYEGSVSVTSSDGGPAVTISAWRQLAVADGQPPGAPTAFSAGQVSKFELGAYEQLAAAVLTP